MQYLKECPICGSNVYVNLLVARHDVTNEEVEQPVLACGKGCFVVPYMGAKFNAPIIEEIGPEIPF